MFNRSRRKIILSIMGSLLLLFAITLTVIMLASYHEMNRKNQDMLEHHVEIYSLDQPTGERMLPEPEPMTDGPREPKGNPPQEPPPIGGGPDYELSTFYSVALADDQTVLAVDNGDKGVYSEENLVSLATEILSEGKTTGNTGHLAYIVAQKLGYTLVAFIDNTVSESSMNTLLHNVLVFGGTAMVLLFFISMFLANRIIRPLEENDQKQKQFVSDASHELKTPVAVISTNAEMLSREIGTNEWLANIQYENERMGGLVRQLLDLSRVESAEAPMEQVDFSRVVTGEALAFETLAFDQGKALQSDIAEGVFLTGNRNQLTQIVSVLLDNAIRHSTGREIEISLKHHGHTSVLDVVNEGNEIPPEKREHLFDRFYRVDEARNSDGQHYGLGLSIAKAAAEKHGGSIGVSCQDGKIRFTVSIPVKKT